MKSVSSAYIASQGKLMSAGGGRGRQPHNVRRAASRYTMKSTGDSESLCGVPTVVLNGADSASSNLTVMFLSDSRNRMIQGTNAKHSGVSLDGLYRTHVTGRYPVFRSRTCIVGT